MAPHTPVYNPDSTPTPSDGPEHPRAARRPGPTALWASATGVVTAVGQAAAQVWRVGPLHDLRAVVAADEVVPLLAAMSRCDTVPLRVRLADNRTLAVLCAALPDRPGEVELAANDVTDLASDATDGDRMFALSEDALCVARTDGYFLRVSPSMCQRLGYPEESLLDRPFLDLVHPDDLTATLGELESLASGARTIGFANRYRRSDGEYLWFQWAASPDLVSGLIYAVARDVTEERRLRAALQAARDEADAANRAKSVFLAHMSHELRTPLNAIIGYGELLGDEAERSDQSGCIDDARAIVEAGQHLLSLINGLLDISRIEAGRVELFVEPFGLADVIRGVAATLNPVAARRGNTLIVDVDDVGLVSDRVKLQQILTNLVGNAVRFTARGTISVSASRLREGWIRIAVTDDGEGIAAEDTERIFLPFEQGSTTSSARTGGTGLGLAIARRFTRLLGGNIAVRSTRGVGTTFTVDLPLHAPYDVGDVTERGHLLVVDASEA